MDESLRVFVSGLVVGVSGYVSCWAALRIADLAWPPPNQEPNLDLGLFLPIGLGAALVALYALHRFDLLFWKYGAFALVMSVLAYVNQQTVIVPNLLTYPLILLGLLQSLIAPPGWRDALVGAIGGGGVLYLFAAISFLVSGKEQLGMGIVKLVAAIGAWLGWQLMAVAVVLGSFAGALTALPASTRGQREIPVGIHVALAAILASIVGGPLVDWYLTFFDRPAE